MSTHSTICLLGASFGTNNMGVNALMAGSLKAFFEQYPERELFLLDYGKREQIYDFRVAGRTVRVPLVPIRFSKKLYLKNNIALLIGLALFIRCIPLAGLRARLISGNYCLNRLNEAEVVVSLAGGDSFSDIYGLARFFYVSLPQVLALVLGKKLVLLPQTIGPFNGLIAKRIARAIMQKAVITYSRDREGISEIEKLIGSTNGHGKIKFCYDVGFLVEPVKPAHLDLAGLNEHGCRPLVGFNISGLLYMGGYTKRNMFGLKVDYQKLVNRIIEHLIRKKGASVLLVPHVFGNKEHAESDSAVCEIVYKELKQKYPDKLYLARGTYDQSEIKYIIGLCDFFIGSRMHACIAALSQNIPAVAIAYSRKFTGVLETIDAASSVADPRELDSRGIVAIIESRYELRASLKRRLEETMPEVKKVALRLFCEIESAVSESTPSKASRYSAPSPWRTR